jgi:hypothetical protein
VLQGALEASILAASHPSRGRAGMTRSASEAAALSAAKAAARAAAAAAIAAGGDGRQLTGEAARVLQPLLDSVLDPQAMKKLLLPLLRLRQACCHPQVRACVCGVCRRTAIGTDSVRRSAAGRQHASAHSSLLRASA